MNIDPVAKHIVPQQATAQRIQEYGVGIFNQLVTKSALKKALKQGLILVNNHVATTATFIQGGETITLLSAKIKASKRALILPLKILFEDNHLAVIHKPAGILVSGNDFKTITNALPQNLKASGLADRTTPQPVHRLDYPTTGVLLIGKTISAIRALNQSFETKAVKKVYYAVVIGQMAEKGEVKTSIDGKEASSKYELIKTVPSKRFEFLSLVKLEPSTGRRHQLRKHLARIGHPILGDSQYGIEGRILKGKGLYLHAYSLSFVHPIQDKIMYATSNMPLKFQKIFSGEYFKNS